MPHHPDAIDRRLLLRSILVVAVWAAALFLLAVLAVRFLQPSWRAGLQPDFHDAAPFFRWDALYYTHIAQVGYTILPDASFFPAFPMLLRMIHAILPIRYDILAEVLSFFIAGFGTVLLAEIVRKRWLTLHRGFLLVILLLPTSFVFLAGYAESLFWTATVIEFYALFQRRFVLSTVMVAIATASRPYGIVFLVPLLVAFIRERRWFAGAGAVLIAGMPIALWFIHLRQVLHDTLALLHSQALFGVHTAWSLPEFIDRLRAFATAQTQSPVYNLVTINHLAALIFAIVGMVGCWRLLPREWFWTMAVALVIVYTRGLLQASNRHIFMLFPLVLGFISVLPWRVRLGWMVVAAALLIANTACFTLWYSVV